MFVKKLFFVLIILCLTTPILFADGFSQNLQTWLKTYEVGFSFQFQQETKTLIIIDKASTTGQISYSVSYLFKVFEIFIRENEIDLKNLPALMTGISYKAAIGFPIWFDIRWILTYLNLEKQVRSEFLSNFLFENFNKQGLFRSKF